MNKHKRNLETLRKYLGRDKHGVKLLDVIARDLTEQRKRIAVLEEAEERMRQTVDRLRDDKAVLEHQQQQAAAETEQADRLRRQAEAKAALAEDKAKRLAENYEAMLGEPDMGEPRDDFTQAYAALVKATKRRMPRHPPPSQTEMTFDPPVGDRKHGSTWLFNAMHWLKEWREPEFTTLGMFVAVYALPGNVVGFYGPRDNVPKVSDTTQCKIAQWFRKNIGEEEWKQRLYAKTDFSIWHPTSDYDYPGRHVYR